MTSFGVDEATANGSLVLKQTYLRYLDPYEKVHFHGEEDDTTNDDWADAEVNKQTITANILWEKTRQMTICHKYFLWFDAFFAAMFKGDCKKLEETSSKKLFVPVKLLIYLENLVK